MSDIIDLDAPLEGIDIATGHVFCRDLRGGPCACEKTGLVHCLSVTRTINGQRSELRDIQQSVEGWAQTQEDDTAVGPKSFRWPTPILRIRLWYMVAKGRLLIRRTRQQHAELVRRGADSPELRGMLDRAEAMHRDAERKAEEGRT